MEIVVADGAAPILIAPTGLAGATALDGFLAQGDQLALDALRAQHVQTAAKQDFRVALLARAS
jgi:hypothetical protein